MTNCSHPNKSSRDLNMGSILMLKFCNNALNLSQLTISLLFNGCTFALSTHDNVTRISLHD